MLLREMLQEALLTPSSLDLITPWWYKIEDINVILFVTMGLAVDLVHWTQGIIKCSPKSCLSHKLLNNSSCQIKDSAIHFINLHCTSLLPWYIAYYPYILSTAAILMFMWHRFPVLWPRFSAQLSRLDKILEKLSDLNINASTYMKLHYQSCNKCDGTYLEPLHHNIPQEQVSEIQREAERAIFDRRGKLVFPSSIALVLLASPCGKITLCFGVLYILRHHYMFISKLIHVCPMLTSNLLHDMHPVICIHVSPASVHFADVVILCIVGASLMASFTYIIFLGRRAIILCWQRYRGTHRRIVTRTERSEAVSLYLDTRRLAGFVYLYDVIESCKRAPVEELIWLLGHGRGIWGEHVINNV